MNIVQTFRRLGQAMSGWNHSVDMQDAQLPLIKKLYSRYNLEIKRTSFACPEQYEVFRNGVQVAYYRLRHGEFTVNCPDYDGKQIMCEEPMGDGIFDDNERLNYLTKALRKVLATIQ